MKEIKEDLISGMTVCVREMEDSTGEVCQFSLN